MDRKTLGSIGLKAPGDAGETGEFTALFARFGVIDHDGDLTLPGAFPVGKTVPISAYGHTSHSGALPVGKGVIREEADAAYIDGRFFLDTQAGGDTYRTVKALVDEATGYAGQEWSYGYDVLDSDQSTQDGQRVRVLKRLDVSEVSPVLLGAGIDTQLVAIKSHKLPFATEAEVTADAVRAFLDRVKARVAERAEQNRPLSDAKRAQVIEVIEAIGGFDALRAELKSLLAERDEAADAARRARMRMKLSVAEASRAMGFPYTTGGSQQ